MQSKTLNLRPGDTARSVKGLAAIPAILNLIVNAHVVDI